ncbi:NADH-cytochrome b5 reductase [Ancistrocladus abbreviatus]
MNFTSWKTQISGLLVNIEFPEAIKDNVIGMVVALVAICIAGGVWFYARKKPKGCLDPNQFKLFRLAKRTQLSHNTARFRFALPRPSSVLGLPVGQHIRCRGKDSQGEEVVRPYTPITLDSDVGYFELVVKMYPKGRMSHHFRGMCEGDYLPVLGPVGRFRYKPGQARAFGMLAGGSGITPMFQLTRAILENRKDKTRIHLIYANVTVDDILLKVIFLKPTSPLSPSLSFSISHHNPEFLWLMIRQPPENWSGGVGFVSKEMIKTHCPAPAPGIMVSVIVH